MAVSFGYTHPVMIPFAGPLTNTTYLCSARASTRSTGDARSPTRLLILNPSLSWLLAVFARFSLYTSAKILRACLLDTAPSTTFPLNKVGRFVECVTAYELNLRNKFFTHSFGSDN